MAATADGNGKKKRSWGRLLFKNGTNKQSNNANSTSTTPNSSSSSRKGGGLAASDANAIESTAINSSEGKTPTTQQPTQDTSTPTIVEEPPLPSSSSSGSASLENKRGLRRKKSKKSNKQASNAKAGEEDGRKSKKDNESSSTRQPDAPSASTTMENDTHEKAPNQEQSTSGENTQDQPFPNKNDSTNSNGQRKSDRMSKARLILIRPFGRQNLPKAKTWVVEVSPAEWDANENRWKYRLLVQRRLLDAPPIKRKGSSDGASVVSDGTAHSFTTAFTWRSLADFLWLEEALRAEYHGALMLPLLSIAIGTPNLLVSQDNAQHDEVDSTLLRDWFSDVLNGIRGQGEMMLDQPIEVITSEAMEAFLYRNTDPLPAQKRQIKIGSLLTTASTLDMPWKDSPMKEVQNESFVDSLWMKPLLCGMDAVCGGEPMRHPSSPSRSKNMDINCCNDPNNPNAIPMGAASPARRTLSDPLAFDNGADVMLAARSELMEAERELIGSYRTSARLSMEKLQGLIEQENQVGAAWKRFGIALSNLFNFEKDVETTKLMDLSEAEKKKKVRLPYRKLTKSTVDELLRVMARQKLERSTPPLTTLKAMLTAFVADLSAVAPSLRAYLDAVIQLAHLDQYLLREKQQSRTEQAKADWSDPIKALTSMKFDDVKKQFTGTSSVSTNTTAASTVDHETIDSQRKAFEIRILDNQHMLQENMRRLCKSTPVRCARMAHIYFSGEAAQAQLLNSAALSTRAKMNVADQKSVASVKKQHILDNKEDDKAEFELIKMIVEISAPKKGTVSSANQAGADLDGNGFPIVDDDDENNSEKRMAQLREKAQMMARTRLGKWDSDLAMTILEACGIEDAEVEVEETTRDLRLVRRLAISLREHLQRCVDALEILKKVTAQNEDGDFPDDGIASVHTGIPASPISETRTDFWDDIASLFSATLVTDKKGNNAKKNILPVISILASAGIVTNDPTGWLQSRRTGHCRESTQQYLNARDVGLSAFLDQVTLMLKEYEKRVQTIESFVYMHCVGIQLEKHFKQERSDALVVFEKKTDIIAAINIAQRKKLSRLVTELEGKMDTLKSNVTATTVKESKEAHLLSKQIKTGLCDIANRRFQRVRETSMDRIVALVTLWAKYEESSATQEIKAVGKCMDELERTLKQINIKADGVSNAFFSSIASKKPVSDR